MMLDLVGAIQLWILGAFPLGKPADEETEDGSKLGCK